MSYNIDSWSTKKLSSFVIPISALYESSRQDWHPEKPVVESFDDPLNVSIHICEDGDIDGELTTDGKLIVRKIHIRGEASGTMFYQVVEPALKKSTGELEAVLVWEGGDSITRLKVSNGDVVQERVEL